MLKKIQRRKRAPSNLAWYSAHSTKTYLSGTKVDQRPATPKVDPEPDVEVLHFRHDKLPQWIIDSALEGDAFHSDDTVELMLGLRDYLINSTADGWDVA
jgi:hypothetical protein